ncbi:MAG: hypothetical protein WC627_12000 [Legionella sp.]|jgi:hypothetical protein
MNDNRYISYNHQTGHFLAIHSDLTILTDYLFIEQLDVYSIVPVSNSKLFEELPTTTLFKLYLSLGGDKAIFESAREIMAQRLRLLDLCRRIAVNLQETKINGFEAGMQAGFVDRQDCKCGYRYKPNSHIPQKV